MGFQTYTLIEHSRLVPCSIGASSSTRTTPAVWHRAKDACIGTQHMQLTCLQRARRQSLVRRHAVAVPQPVVQDTMQRPPRGSQQHRHDAHGRLMLKNLTMPELEDWCVSVGEASKRAQQLWRWMYADGLWATDLSDADHSTNAFSAAFKAKVSASASLSGGLQLQSAHTARDGTHKLVFQLIEGEGSASGSVETVLIPRKNRAGTIAGYTACLSTQVGCAQNCQFCLTGRMGLLGNLTTAQVVEQVVAARRWLQQEQQQQLPQQQQQQQQQHGLQQRPHIGNEPSSSHRSSRGDGRREHHQPTSSAEAAPSTCNNGIAAEHQQSTRSQHPAAMSSQRRRPLQIGNIVFMGMGEPLHNIAAVMPTLDIITHPQGLALSKNKVIVSTVGLIPEMKALHATGKAKLAVSLHATTDEVRSWIVPTNRRYPLDQLMAALEQMYPKHSAKGDDFVLIEYVMLAGVNDSDADAQRLLQLTERVYCMINLIAFNAHDGTRFRRSSDDRMEAFKAVLTAGGRVCTLRLSKGDDEMAACGQLGDVSLSVRPAPILQPPPHLLEALLL